MTFTYTIGAGQFLEYYLYMVSESKVIQRKRNIAKYSFSVIYLILGIYFFAFKTVLLGGAFVLISIAWFLLYPVLNKKSLARFYKKYIDENYAQKMNQRTEMIITSEFITVKDENNEHKILIPELEKIIETTTCFYVKLHSGTSFIVPKNQIHTDTFKTTFETLQLPFENKTDWKWN